MTDALNNEDPTSAASSSVATAGTVNDRMVKGAFWMLLARGLDRGLGFVSTIVLARLLLPEDFGLVAMATAIVAVLEIVRSFGFDVALIQNQRATRAHYDTAWTCNIILGLLIAVLLAAMSLPAARFYDEPRVIAVMLCLALANAIGGFENIGVVAFRKELRFNKEFKLFMAYKAVTFLVTIPLAIMLRNYWALVVGMLVGRVASVALTYLLHPYRPRLSLEERGELFHFGKWLVTSTLLNVINTRSADFLIGKTSGPHALGVYGISYEIANLPTSDLIAPINRAMLPGYATKAANLKLLASSYLEVMGVVALLAAPAAFGISAIADLMVPVLLGSNWLDAAPVISTLAFFGLLLALKSNNHYIYLALGKSRLTTLVGALQLVFLVPLVTWGALRAGPAGAALGCVIAEVIFTPLSMWLIRRELELRHWEVYRPFVRPLLAAVTMFVAVRFAVEFVKSGSESMLILGLVACVVLGALVYALAILVLWLVAGRPPTAEWRALEFVQTKLWPRIRGLRLVVR